MRSSGIRQSSATCQAMATGGGCSAIYAANSNPRIADNTISDNNAGRSGGALQLKNATAIIEQNIFNNNEVHAEGNVGTHSSGGAIYAYNSSINQSKNTFNTNRATGYPDTFSGRVIFTDRSTLVLDNNNLQNDTTEELYFNFSNSPSSVTVAYSDVQAGRTAVVTNNNGTLNWQEGNIDEDPQFNDTAVTIFL